MRILYYSLKNETFLKHFLSPNAKLSEELIVYLKETVLAEMEAETFRRKVIDVLKIQVEIRLEDSERKEFLMRLLSRIEAQPEIDTKIG